ncbi:GNAT family N-acetyltransferase [Bradyrhizobium sp. Gha]|uniref:GNAT family N-acetyltransferase n=1 Tax=Bradyrhizobium sp. Gha TaxID=1855318 RepID=UPI0008EE3EEA|nr:GNAT family N-acetyltransferase [Bradyrhizobium sp. Gha]SFK14296.1 Acetyltransferase (GNAT) domain-containing protein [Bradyrhizobium sp. Gha]
MQTISIKFAERSAEHLDDMLKLTLQAKWPHRREDLGMCFSVGCGYVALVDDHVVGTVCIAFFGEVAIINLLIVDEKMRGRGIGEHLMKLGLEKARECECRLVATADGLPLYRKLGFRKIETVTVHQGAVAPVKAPRGVEWATREDFEHILDIDRGAYGMDRKALIGTLWETARFAIVRNSGRIAGYAAGFRYGRGEIAGPVIACSPDDAQRLLSLIFSERTGAFFRVDLRPESGLAVWLNSIGLPEVGTGTSMCRGDGGPNGPRQLRSYGLATMQFM